MFSLSSILEKNRATFYNYRTGADESIRPRLWITLVISACLGAFASSELSNFLDGVITVQAILIGFSFSVMTFLVSNGIDVEVGNSGSIERKRRVHKLRTLGQEIFYNLSYFNIVATLCLACALMLLLPSGIYEIKARVEQFTSMPKNLSTAIDVVDACLCYMAAVIFYFLLLESGYTFARTVRRVNFLFSEKIDLSKTQKGLE